MTASEPQVIEGGPTVLNAREPPGVPSGSDVA